MAALEESVEAAKAARGRHPTARKAPAATAQTPSKPAAEPRARQDRLTGEGVDPLPDNTHPVGTLAPDCLTAALAVSARG